jgi:hypothetical protein
MTDEEDAETKAFLEARDKAAAIANRMDELLVSSSLIVAEMALGLLVAKLVCNARDPWDGLKDFHGMVQEMLHTKLMIERESGTSH